MKNTPLMLFLVSPLAMATAMAANSVTENNQSYTANQSGLYEDFTQVGTIKTFNVSNGAIITMTGPSGSPLVLTGQTVRTDAGNTVDIKGAGSLVTVNSDLEYQYGSNTNSAGKYVYNGIAVTGGGRFVLNGNLTASSTNTSYSSPKSAMYVDGTTSSAELNGNANLTIAAGKGLFAANGGTIDMTSDSSSPYVLTVTNKSSQRSVEANNGGTVTLDLVDMNGTGFSNGVGLYATKNSSITFMGGDFNQGSNSRYGANALFALNHSSVTATGYDSGHLRIKTAGTNEMGAWATGNSVVEINSEKHQNFETVIHTTGTGQSHGLAAGSLGGGSASAPANSTGHAGSQYGNSEVTVYGKADITTEGKDSAGLRVMGDGAKITLTPLVAGVRNSITSAASAIRYSFANGYSLASNGDRLEGGQVIDLTDTDMAHLDGATGTAGLIEVGGLAGRTSDGQNSGIMNVADAVQDATLNLANSSATAQDGRSLLNVNTSQNSADGAFASSFTLNAENSELVGRAVTDSTVASDGSVSSATLNLKGSRWFLLDKNSSDANHYTTSNLTALDLQDGSQVFLNSRESWQNGFAANQPEHYGSLQLGSLSGAGAFHFYTDIVNQLTDKLTISDAGGSTGSHSVLVANDGSQSTLGNERIEIIETNGGSGQFGLYEGALVELGGNTYALRKNEGDNWELYGYTAPPVDPGPTDPVDPTPPGPDPEDPTPPGPIEPGNPVEPAPPAPGPGPGTSTTRAFHAQVHTNYLLSYLDMQTLLQRMGELRYTERDTDGNVWLRTNGGRLHSFAGGNFDGYRLSYQGIQLGVDRRVPVSSGDLFVGAMLGHTEADQSFDEGSGGARNTHVGIYGTWLHENGFYIDAVLKAARLKNNFSVSDTQGNRVKSSGHSTGYSASLEAGKRFSLHREKDSQWFVEPQAQLVYTDQGGFSSRASNGLKIHYDDYDSLLARAGGIVGYELSNAKHKSEVYLKGGYVRELMADDIGYRVNGTPKQSSDFSGGWREAAVGISTRLEGGHSLFMEVGYRDGDNFDQNHANVGYRFEY
ncbi:autotransporter outer membrane beta-barrel domain-containing protein [Pseudomonas sp. PDNC002]|uniref:autotransporter outer membrane beta-barrel domain-containing protein n=1 Tax=Pseudomonas sp. PDNC002 TaxID=2811422 RepID=UPI001966143B|nr:autotransporter outer membrane beta-barrel domain-containing protein [Pseudomonas sp. PDNC002]QRY77438.1 autotransporter outer membrane beta-barrel domain-containing protein [Pseudomonas sp. PDNC002]